MSAPRTWRLQRLRIRERWRRLRERGATYYVLAVLCLSVAFGFARHAYVVALAHYERLKTDVEVALASEHEARRDDRHFGVIAALLGGLNARERQSADASQAGELCPFDEPECRKTERLLTLFAALAKSADATFEQCATTSAEWREQADPPEMPARHDESVWSTLFDLSPEDICIFWRMNAQFLVPCDEDRKKADAPGTYDGAFGPMLCEYDWWKKANPRLFVSSLLARPDNDDLQPRVLRASVVSRVLNLAAAADLDEDCVNGALPYQVVNFYFVSPDSVFRLWECHREDERVLNRFPRTRQWAAAHYMEEIIKTGNEYRSPAYVDYAGAGIVRTHCKPVLGADTPPSLLGAICADNRIPLDALVDELAGTELLKVMRVTTVADPDDPVSLQSAVLDIEQLAPPGRGSVWALPDADELRRARSVMQTLLSQGKDVVKRISVHHEAGTDPWFLVPLGKEDARGWTYLLVTPRIDKPAIALDLLWTFGFAFAALIFAWRSVVHAREHKEGALMANLLSNLEEGVVIVDDSDRIEAVNDRAEQILGLPLPKIGPSLKVEEGLRRTRRLDDEVIHEEFGNIIEDTVWQVMGEEALERQPYGWVETLRRQGDSSTYYARLRKGTHRDDYILVSAAPILLGEPTTDAWPDSAVSDRRPRTFGIIQRVAGDRAERLRRRIERNFPSKAPPAEAGTRPETIESLWDRASRAVWATSTKARDTQVILDALERIRMLERAEERARRAPRAP